MCGKLKTKEEWRYITGYKNLYQVSNIGRIKSFHKYKDGKILKPALDKHTGYYQIILCVDKKQTNCKVHRLVAKTFIKNPENKNYINHIDENKKNNSFNNLEWVTQKENMNSGTVVQRLREKSSIKVVAIYSDNTYEIFDSFKECGEVLHIYKSGVSRCVNGIIKSINGIKFEKFSDFKRLNNEQKF